jgi:hypothetical protein
MTTPYVYRAFDVRVDARCLNVSTEAWTTMMETSYALIEEATATVRAPADALFDYLDDQARLGTRMEKPSMMMMGGRMRYEFDAAKGRAEGSVITMRGSVLGLKLLVEEVVLHRDPPRRKVWETRGRPRILIIGTYRMGFEIAPTGANSELLLFIEYNMPTELMGRILGWLFASVYARCRVPTVVRARVTRQMSGADYAAILGVLRAVFSPRRL